MSTAPPPHHRSDARSAAAGQESPTDDVLMGRIQCADERALATLFDRWVDRVYSVAAHILGNGDEADDVVERTFLHVWQEAKSYDAARGSVGAWITVIARSRALSLLRTEKRRLRLEELRSGHLVEEGSISAASPLRRVEASEHRELVEEAVNRLPDEQQRVVRMTFFDALSQSEIAARLGVPLGTVKTRVRLAFAKLRDSLAVLQERDR